MSELVTRFAFLCTLILVLLDVSLTAWREIICVFYCQNRGWISCWLPKNFLPAKYTNEDVRRNLDIFTMSSSEGVVMPNVRVIFGMGKTTNKRPFLQGINPTITFYGQSTYMQGNSRYHYTHKHFEIRIYCFNLKSYTILSRGESHEYW